MNKGKSNIVTSVKELNIPAPVKEGWSPAQKQAGKVFIDYLENLSGQTLQLAETPENYQALRIRAYSEAKRRGDRLFK